MPKSRAQHSGVATRERILRAAEELIVEVGWSQVTTRRIAARAGVNQALVHYHFGTVTDVLRLAVMAAIERELVEPTEQILSTDSPGEGIRRVSDWLRKYEPGSSMAVLSAEVMAQAMRDEVIRAWLARLLVELRAQMAVAIDSAQAYGSLRDDVSADGVAVLTAALIDGLLLHGLVDPRVDFETVARTLDAALATTSTKENTR